LKRIAQVYSPTFVEYWINPKIQGNFVLVVNDYIFRGKELEDFSVWDLAHQRWQKYEIEASKKKKGKGVNFLDGHPESKTYWLFQKEAKRGQEVEAEIVFIVRRKRYIKIDELREKFALCIAVPWRRLDDLEELQWDRVKERHNRASVKALEKMLYYEMLIAMPSKRPKEQQGDLVPEKTLGQRQPSENDKDDEREFSAISRVGTIVDDLELDSLAGIGGDKGAKAVRLANACGLIPSLNFTRQDALLPIDFEEEFIMNWDTYSSLLPKKQEREADWVGEVEFFLEVRVAGSFVDFWYRNSPTLAQANCEHKAAIMPCILYLADCFCNISSTPFSLIVQGSGGTGKTMTVVKAVKEFVDLVCTRTGNKYWMEFLLLLAPTNLTALNMGGQTLDSGLFN
jgi:hypothetical protein